MRTPTASAFPAVRFRWAWNHRTIPAIVMTAVVTIAVSCSGKVSGSGTSTPGSLEYEQVTTAEIVGELGIEVAGEDPPAVRGAGRVAAHLVRLIQEDLERDAPRLGPGGQQQRAGLDPRIVRALAGEVAHHVAEGERVDGLRAVAGQVQRLIEDRGQLPEHGLHVARIDERTALALARGATEEAHASIVGMRSRRRTGG